MNDSTVKKEVVSDGGGADKVGIYPDRKRQRWEKVCCTRLFCSPAEEKTCLLSSSTPPSSSMGVHSSHFIPLLIIIIIMGCNYHFTA